MQEIWRDIEEYNGLLRISSEGNILNTKSNTIITNLTKSSYGYWYYQFYYNRKHRNIYLHKEVAKAFPEICGEYKEGYVAHHLNGDKEDNRAVNLILVSQSEHMKIHCTENPERVSGLKSGFYGPHSEETKLLISKKNKGKNKGEDNYLSTPVLMIDKNNGQVLKDFASIHIAGEYLGDVNKQANIWKCLTGKINSAYGYKWTYK